MSCAVCFRRDDRLVLAADRLFQVSDGAGRSTMQAAKVRLAGAWHYWALGYYIHPGAREHVYDRITRVIAPHVTIAGAMQALYDALGAVLFDAFGALHRSGHVAMLDVIVGGLENGRVVAGQYEAFVKQADPFEVACRAAVAPGDVMHAASLAAGPAIDLMERRPRPAWLERGDAAAALRLIALQAAATPELVRGCDVLQIDREDGARFVFP